jgi:hypothetical protein
MRDDGFRFISLRPRCAAGRSLNPSYVLRVPDLGRDGGGGSGNIMRHAAIAIPITIAAIQIADAIYWNGETNIAAY